MAPLQPRAGEPRGLLDRGAMPPEAMIAPRRGRRDAESARFGPSSRPSRSMAVTSKVSTPASASAGSPRPRRRQGRRSSSRRPIARPSRTSIATAIAGAVRRDEAAGKRRIAERRRADHRAGGPAARVGDAASSAARPRPRPRIRSPTAATIARSQRRCAGDPTGSIEVDDVQPARPRRGELAATGDRIVRERRLASKSPCSRRTTRPPRRSIAAGTRSACHRHVAMLP